MTEHPKPTDHAYDCDWHLDQYWWECTCGVYAERIAGVAKTKAAHPGAQMERAIVVAWLRGAFASGRRGLTLREYVGGRIWLAVAAIFAPHRLSQIHYRACANAIERGEHLKGEK